MIGKITRKSMRARFGPRRSFIGLAILLGVSFVAGSFVLADSLTLDVRQPVQRAQRERRPRGPGRRSPSTTSKPCATRSRPRSPTTIAAVDGVAIAEPSLQPLRPAARQGRRPDRTRKAHRRSACRGPGPSGISGVTLKDGEAPDGPDEVVIDKVTADKQRLRGRRRRSTIVFDTGTATFTIVGLVGLGDTDGFGGATLASFDPETARQVLGAGDTYDAIDIKLAEGADPATVRPRSRTCCRRAPRSSPASRSPRRQPTTSTRSSRSSAPACSIFAFITTFVSAFIINNVFGITIGQRLRELALMRGVGASTKQVRRLIVLEALIISVTATMLGIVAGVSESPRSSSPSSTPPAPASPTPRSMLQPRTVIVSLIVGVGVTMLSVLVPARRAAKVPPVAAMRPEIGFAALSSSRRLIGGTIVTARRRGDVPGRPVRSARAGRSA